MKKSLLLISLLSLAGAASAGDVFQHPAVFSPRSLPSVDVNTFIVGHPAHGFTGQAQTEADKATTAQPRAQRAEEVAQAAPRNTAAATRQQ
jgi:hypothetical protein